MWKALQKTPPYFITLYTETADFYYIGATDYQRCWLSYTSRASFLADLKVSNDGLEFDDENELVEKGLDMIRTPDTLKKVSILLDDGGHLLTISMIKVYDFPLKLELGLLEASSAHFFKMVIQPLLKTVSDLHSSQEELRKLLKLKDREIDKYRSDGFVPKRAHLPVYDDAAHMVQHNIYTNNYGAPEVQDLLQAISNTEVEDIKPAPESASTTAGPKRKEVTDAQPINSFNLPEQNPKVEKCSQSTLVDEIESIVPISVNESDIKSFTTVSNKNANAKNDSEKESKGPVRRKRRHNRLSY